MNKYEIYVNGLEERGDARFKVNNSWVCFTTSGRIYVVEYGVVLKEDFASIPNAIAWVRDFGDRD